MNGVIHRTFLNFYDTVNIRKLQINDQYFYSIEINLQLQTEKVLDNIGISATEFHLSSEEEDR